MAVVADIDGLDLWVEPHAWTDEDRRAFDRAVQEYREKHPLSDAERDAMRACLREKFGIHVRQPVRSD